MLWIKNLLRSSINLEYKKYSKGYKWDKKIDSLCQPTMTPLGKVNQFLRPNCYFK